MKKEIIVFKIKEEPNFNERKQLMENLNKSLEHTQYTPIIIFGDDIEIFLKDDDRILDFKLSDLRQFILDFKLKKLLDINE